MDLIITEGTSDLTLSIFLRCTSRFTLPSVTSSPFFNTQIAQTEETLSSLEYTQSTDQLERSLMGLQTCRTYNRDALDYSTPPSVRESP